MRALDVIANRRSIRRFQEQAVSRDLIERVLAATVLAPSGKNAQPWRFVVLEGSHRDRLVRMMLERAAKLKEQGWNIGSLEWTAKSMAKAPVAIVIFMPPLPEGLPAETHEVWRLVMVQSVGGAIQTMLLAAHDLGLGSLWICDILFAEDEVRSWLGRPGETLVAAVSLGYADEAPGPRPRRPWQEVTEWLAEA